METHVYFSFVLSIIVICLVHYCNLGHLFDRERYAEDIRGMVDSLEVYLLHLLTFYIAFSLLSSLVLEKWLNAMFIIFELHLCLLIPWGSRRLLKIIIDFQTVGRQSYIWICTFGGCCSCSHCLGETSERKILNPFS